MGMPKTRGCPYHCDTGLPSGREPVPGVQIVERGRKIHEQKKKNERSLNAWNRLRERPLVQTPVGPTLRVFK